MAVTGQLVLASITITSALLGISPLQALEVPSEFS